MKNIIGINIQIKLMKDKTNVFIDKKEKIKIRVEFLSKNRN